jgi:hypothetical protein
VTFRNALSIEPEIGVARRFNGAGNGDLVRTQSALDLVSMEQL